MSWVRGLIGAGAMALAVGGCAKETAGAAASVASGFDETAITRAIKQQLEGKRFAEMLGMRSCNEVFVIGEPRLTARHIEGNAGQVEVSTPVTAQTAVPPQGWAESCFGNVSGGFAAGQTANYVHVYQVERWDTGWRLGQGQ